VPDDEQKSADKFGPEAIAARIEKMGEESEADKTAREEEQKLLARRKQQKKSGLEAAASKRLAKIGETAVKRPSAVSADPGLDRATKLTKWVEANRQTVGLLVGVAVIGGGGLAGWWYVQDKHTIDASLLLGQAFLEGGHRFSAFANLIKNLSIGDTVHVLHIGEGGGPRVIVGGVGTIAFAGFAMALDAFIEIDGASGGEGGRRRPNRIFPQLRFFGDFPGAILGNGIVNREAQKGKNEHQ